MKTLQETEVKAAQLNNFIKECESKRGKKDPMTIEHRDAVSKRLALLWVMEIEGTGTDAADSDKG